MQWDGPATPREKIDFIHSFFPWKQSVVVGIQGRWLAKVGKALLTGDTQKTNGAAPIIHLPLHCPHPPPLIQLLAQRHTQHELRGECSGVQPLTRRHLLSHSPSISTVRFRDSFSFLQPMPVTKCPVLGCKSWSNSWGKRSYPLPSPDVFTLLLASDIDVSTNNRICSEC